MTLSAAEQQKLRDIVKRGVELKEKHKLENDSLKETIKVVSEELGMSSKSIRKAIGVAQKGNFQDEEQVLDEVESILHASGYSV